MIQKKKFLNKQFNQKNNKYKSEKKIYNQKNNKYPFEKKRYNQKNNKYPFEKKIYNQKNNKNYTYNKIKKSQKPKITDYLYRNKKIKKGIFFKKPTFNNVLYPFYLNLKLINEYLKKK